MELFQERVLKVLFILIWILALIHMSAEYFHLYWLFKWFDLIPHFLGGVWVGLSGIWIWYFSGYFKNMELPDKNVVIIAILFGFIIGFVWEAYEYVIKQLSGAGLPVNYVFDSVLDLLMDVIGAFAGFLTFKYITKDISV